MSLSLELLAAIHTGVFKGSLLASLVCDVYGIEPTRTLLFLFRIVLILRKRISKRSSQTDD